MLQYIRRFGPVFWPTWVGGLLCPLGFLLVESRRGQEQMLWATVALGSFFWGQILTTIFARKSGIKGTDLITGQMPFGAISVVVSLLYHLFRGRIN
jgi:hypothetical protein